MTSPADRATLSSLEDLRIKLRGNPKVAEVEQRVAAYSGTKGVVPFYYVGSMPEGTPETHEQREQALFLDLMRTDLAFEQRKPTDVDQVVSDTILTGLAQKLPPGLKSIKKAGYRFAHLALDREDFLEDSLTAYKGESIGCDLTKLMVTLEKVFGGDTSADLKSFVRDPNEWQMLAKDLQDYLAMIGQKMMPWVQTRSSDAALAMDMERVSARMPEGGNDFLLAQVSKYIAARRQAVFDWSGHLSRTLESHPVEGFKDFEKFFNSLHLDGLTDAPQSVRTRVAERARGAVRLP